MNTQKESDILVKIDARLWELMDMIDYHISNCTEDDDMDTITEIKRLAQNVWDAVPFHHDGQPDDSHPTQEGE